METLDPQVVNLAKSIRQVESDNNFKSQGASGEYGAYQFTPNTWNGTSKKYGMNVQLEQATPEQQNEVAYKQIKEWKDKGHNVGEIASMWNAGESKPNAYLDGNKGVNKYGVSYDTAGYAKKVAEQYQQLKSQPDTQPNQNTSTSPQPPQETGLGEQLTQRGVDVGNAVQQTLQGKINPISGVFQTVGGVAGMVGDVTGKALELIPGVKQVENLLGQGVGALAQTDIGKAVVKSISDFSNEYPELSKDIGAGFNIATAIPILKGLGALKNVVLDATSSALKSVAEKSLTTDLTETLSRTVGGKKILAKSGNDYIKTLIDERAIPEIVGNKYSTQNAFEKLGQRISDIDNKVYQPLLDNASRTNGVQTSFMPLKNIEQNAIKLAQDELKNTAPIKDYFERLRIKYGEYPPIDELNKAKRIVSKNITEAGFASPTYSTDEIVRKSLQTAVEEGGRALGIPNIDAVNQEMAQLIKAQKMLTFIENKPIKSGLVGETVKNVATVGGEMAGTATGIPIAGTLAGREAGGFVGKKLTGITEGILKRTGKDAERVTVQELKKKLGGLFGGVAGQKITNQKTGILQR